MHFGFALYSSDIDLWNINLLDTHLDLLDTDIHSKYFVCLQGLLNASSRHVFKRSWRRLQRNNFASFKTFSRRLCKTCLRRLEDALKTSWKTKNCYAEDVLKTSSRHNLKTSWRRLEDQQTFAGLILKATVKTDVLMGVFQVKFTLIN